MQLRDRTFRAGHALVIAFVFSLPITVKAQSRADDPLLQASLWVRASEYQDASVSSADRYKASLITKYLIAVFNQTPDMSASDLRAQYNFVVAATDGTLFPSTEQTIARARTYAAEMPGPFEYVKPLADFAADMAIDLKHASEADSDRDYQRELYENSLDSEETFIQAYRLAVSHPDTFGAVLDRDIFPRFLKLPTDASIDQIVQAYPSLNLTREKALLSQLKDGSPEISEAAADQIAQSVVATAKQKLQETAKTRTTHRPSPSTSRSPGVSSIEDIRAEYSDGRDSVAIISTLMELGGDPRMQDLGRRYASMAFSVISFSETLELYKSTNKISDVALFRSGLGCATAIMASFGGSPGNDAEMGALNDIIGELRSLRQEMNERFADLELDVTRLFEALDKISAVLSVHGYQLDQLQNEISYANERLQFLSLQASVIAQSQAGDEINGRREHCLDYDYIPGLSFMEFVSCLDDFEATATISAHDDVFEPYKGRNQRADAVAIELQQPLDGNLKYLNALLADRDVTHDRPDLPNPTIWLEEANAYVDLASQYPNYFANLITDRKVQNIIGEGKLLATFSQEIGASDPKSHKATVSTKLLSPYQKHVSKLSKDIDSHITQQLIFAVSQKPAGSGLSVTTMIPCGGLKFATTPDWNQLHGFVNWPLYYYSNYHPLEWQSLNIFPGTAMWLDGSKLGQIQLCYSGVMISGCKGNTIDTSENCNYRVEAVGFVGEIDKPETDVKLFEAPFDFSYYVTLNLDTSFNRFVNEHLGLNVNSIKEYFARWVAAQLATAPSATALTQYAAFKLWKAGPDLVAAANFVRNELVSPGDTYYVDAETLSGEKSIIGDSIRIAFPTEYDRSVPLRQSLRDDGLIDRLRLVRALGCLGLQKTDKCDYSPADRKLADQITIAQNTTPIVDTAKREIAAINKAIQESPASDVDPSIQATLNRLYALDLVYEINKAKREQPTVHPAK